MRGKAEFKELNGDDTSNADLMAKFGVKGFPTLIFTDSTQKILRQTHGMAEDEFKATIAEFVK
jgi:thioredoxin-related protein